MKMRMNLYKKKIKKKIIFWAVVAAVILICGLFFERIYPNYIARVDMCLENIANEIMNEALLNTLDGGYDFEKITKNGEDKITESDTVEMNLFKAKYTQELYKIMKEKECEYISIPLGSLSNKAIFSGLGPDLRIKTKMFGTVKTDFKDGFVSCGINSVKHKIYLETTISCRTVSAAMSRKKTVTVSVPMTETLITGDVPNYYGANTAAIYAKGE